MRLIAIGGGMEGRACACAASALGADVHEVVVGVSTQSTSPLPASTLVTG